MKTGIQIIFINQILKFKTMKTSILLLAVSFFLFSFKPLKNDFINLPHVNLISLEGKTINMGELKSDKSTIICFWSISDKASIDRLNAIQENYSANKNAVRIIAISTDNNAFKVKPEVIFSGWDFEVYIDLNQDFKKAMGAGDSQSTIVINRSGKTICSNLNDKSENETALFTAIDNSILTEINTNLLAKAE